MAQKFTLNLNIAPQVLSIIKAAGQRITLAKPVGNGDPNVIWLSIDPFQATSVEWTEEYWIYASATEVSPREKISKLSEVTPGPAFDAGYYPFTSAAVFNPIVPTTDIPKGTYAADNDMPFINYPALTFGLSQSALVNQQPNERKPISAQTVLATQRIEMTPFTNVHIWLQSEFASETIIESIVGNSVVAKFGGGIDNISLAYDPNRGIFVPEVDALIEDGTVEIRTPLVA